MKPLKLVCVRCMLELGNVIVEYAHPPVPGTCAVCHEDGKRLRAVPGWYNPTPTAEDELFMSPALARARATTPRPS